MKSKRFRFLFNKYVAVIDKVMHVFIINVITCMRTYRRNRYCDHMRVRVSVCSSVRTTTDVCVHGYRPNLVGMNKGWPSIFWCWSDSIPMWNQNHFLSCLTLRDSTIHADSPESATTLLRDTEFIHSCGDALAYVSLSDTPRLAELCGRSFWHSVILSVSRISHNHGNGRRPNMVGMSKGWPLTL